MRTKDEMEAYARGFAESHFYSDEACEVVWQPFEDYPEEWMAGEVDALADAMVRAMLWVQEGEKT